MYLIKHGEIFIGFIIFVFYATFYFTSFVANEALKSYDHAKLFGTISVFVRFFTMMTTGILTAFCIRARYILFFGITCFFTGLFLLQYSLSLSQKGRTTNATNYIDKIDNNSMHYVMAMVSSCLISIHYGIFRIILPVLMIDQVPKFKTNYAISFYMFILNAAFIIEATLFPTNSTTEGFSSRDANYYIILPIFIIGVLMLIFGMCKTNLTLDHSYNIQTLRNSNNNFLENLGTYYEESRNILLLRFVTVFWMMLPYGICDTQVDTSFKYQSRQMKLNFTCNVYHNKSSEFSRLVEDISLCVIILVIGLTKLTWQKFRTFYNQNKIALVILGKISFLISISLAAVVEYFRLKIYWGNNSTTLQPASDSFAQTIDGHEYQAANMSVWWLVYPIVFSALAEILISITCIEFLYRTVPRNMVYLSVAMVLGVVGDGSLGNIFNILIEFLATKTHLYNVTNLNARIPYKDHCCKSSSNLVYLYFYLIGLSVISIITSLLILRRYYHRYQLLNSDAFYNSDNSQTLHLFTE